MNNTIETLNTVQASARTHKDPEPRVITKESTLPYGCTMRQGDVMLTRHPIGTKLEGTTAQDADRQLAPGSTVGSRHIVRPGPQVLKRNGQDVLHGPVIVAPEGLYVEHPVHAHMDCRLPGVYEVTYPRDYASEQLQRRRD